MDLEPFVIYTKAETLEQAFVDARGVFNFNKGACLPVKLPKGWNGYHYAVSLIESRDPRFTGPWSPAGAIHQPPGFYIFGFSVSSDE